MQEADPVKNDSIEHKFQTSSAGCGAYNIKNE
jgi:hypothetical protein